MDIEIKLSDGKIKNYKKDITVEKIIKDISISLFKKSIYALINNKKVNMNFKIQNNSTLKIITTDDDIDQEINFSCAKMISEIIKNNLLQFNVINFESNENYFFLDIDSKETIKENDLLNLNNKILKYSKNFKSNDSWLIINSKFFNNFKFLSVSGIYLEGNKNNKMINRIIGLSSFDNKNLLIKEKNIKIAMESDHRIIGNKMKLFMFDNMIGAGLPVWLPNGMILKNEIANFIKKKQLKYGFLEVETPILGNIEMYKTSGHLSHYKDTMFPQLKTNSEILMLRPMSCPHHIVVFKNDLYSYRDLPLRISEHAHLFRYELSGSLTGLERVRMMQLTDAHIFVILKQLKEEVKNCFKLIMEILKTFNIEIYYFSLSLRDKNNKNKYYDDDEMWDFAENQLKEVLDELKLNYKEIPGEAAFYGPKLDVQIQSILKHEITVSTIQLDMISAKNFQASYIDENNKKINPIIIHFGLIGTYERFISVLLEQTKGILPLWLCPEQIRIIPVNDKVLDYCLQLKHNLRQNNIRVSIDQSDERLNYKIRQAQINKIPYQLIIGEKEKNDKMVALRRYSSIDTIYLTCEKLIKNVIEQIKIKK